MSAPNSNALLDANRDPRGVTVFTGETAEFFNTADDWYLDDKGNLHVVDTSGRRVALFFIGTALRTQAGPPPQTPS